MGFWDTSDNKKAFDSASSSFSYESNEYRLIPDDTECLSRIKDIKWLDYEGVFYINVVWSILEGQYKNRLVFQKIKVNERDASKRDRAVKMLAAIDSNAGSKLPKHDNAPTDEELSLSLVGAIMIVVVGEWEISGKSGNWVKAVKPSGEHDSASNHEPASASQDIADEEELSDEIPF